MKKNAELEVWYGTYLGWSTIPRYPRISTTPFVHDCWLGGVLQPLQVYPRSGLLIEAVLDEGGVLRRVCPDAATLLRECLLFDATLRPCAREVLDRLLAIGASDALGLVEPGTRTLLQRAERRAGQGGGVFKYTPV
jgi:hypothetical protein